MQKFLKENWLFLLILATMLGGFLYLRTPGDRLASIAAFDAQVSAGQPTLVEFYSNT